MNAPSEVIELPVGDLLKHASPEALARELLTRIPKSDASRERLAELRANRPKIGDQGLHGIYAGIARADDTMGDHIVEVLAEAPSKMTWDAAKAWAESIGGTLPTRKEQALLFANVPELFEKEWYWSCEQYAGGVSSAWFQYFYYGLQSTIHELTELRARAVRRLPIE